MACTEADIVDACRGGRGWSKVQKVAKACNTPTHGLFTYFPFSAIGRQKYTCARLFAVNTNSLLRKSMDQQAIDFFTSLANLPQVRQTQYEGFIQNGIFALLYLLKRNHNECVVLAGFDKVLKRLLNDKHMSMERLDWSQFSIVWSPDAPGSDPPYSIKVPGGSLAKYSEQITSCLNKKKKSRFFLSLVTMVSVPPRQTFHANVLFYDKVTGLLERFEPFQAQFEDYRSKRFDVALARMFRRIDPGGYRDMVNPPNMEAVHRQGLQLKAEQEVGEGRKGDPLGFCLPWSLMYADARLTLANQDPSSIPQLFEIMAAEYDLSLTKFIRNYAENFEEVNWKVYVDFLKRYPKYKKFDDPMIPMYALFLKQLSEYAAFYS